MVTADALSVARALQAEIMLDTVTVTVLGEPVWDEAAQASTRPETTLYSGRARVATVTAGAPTLSPSGATVTPAQVALTVPWDTGDFPTSARVTVTASTATNPLVGATVYVDDETTGHIPTARRYMCRMTA